MGRAQSRGPDFLIVGGERCATTWLANNLRASEGVWIPPIKELHYFNRQIAGWRDQRMRRRVLQHLGKRAKAAAVRMRDGRSPGLGLWDLRYFFGVRNDRWYTNLFSGARRNGWIAGEATPGYALLDEALLERIRRLNPDIRIVFVMRDPVERAWSAVNKNVRNGRWPAHLSLDEKIRYAISGDVITYSRYTATVQRLDRVFPEDRLFYGFYEDLVAEPRAFVADVLRHIGVENPDTAGVDVRASNASGSGGMVPDAFRNTIGPWLVGDVEQLCTRFGGYPCQWRDGLKELEASDS